ncbi:hypothetical protein N798_00200 [Knoellia flava TL1]|uniref:Uncharacterized protein n=2 Tax=Knoellia flava TaxID=913969 RepID=A0A8H9FTW6_9MICO|nr:hypothetical protein [Knoellia flava]KGN36004.1 hypothetical protein N798_00200 [Knoellia flava TL1]GGB81444.1 hypothetical protein GCM10011314_21320 [Knoellia flava]
MSRTTTTSHPATDAALLLRQPDRPLPYPLLLRIADVLAGRRDGRSGLAGDLVAYCLADDATTWLRHNQHRLTERVHSETVRHDALALSLHQEAAALPGQIKDTKRELRAAHAALAELPPTPSNPTARRATEAHTDATVVTARRAREHHDTVLAPARARVANAEHALSELRTRRRDIIATLTALAQVHAQRTGRLTEFHARRAHAYERAYLRRLAGTHNDPTTTATVA